MVLRPDLREITRYLGYHGVTPDENIMSEIEQCIGELENVITPRFVYDRFDLRQKDEDGRSILSFGGLETDSRDLARNLKGCTGVYIMAVTLGPGPDRLVRRASVGKMSRAIIFQAAAAAMTEAWCDEINERIRTEAAKEGFCTRPRFSPGYGDLPLSMQKQISMILNMPKEIGVSLTESYLMIPSKSVTALIGVFSVADESGTGNQKPTDEIAASQKPANSAAGKCANCAAAENCPYADKDDCY
jgi:hypothetical protein